MVAQVTGSGHHVTSPIVVDWGGMSKPWVLSHAMVVKSLFSAQENVHSTFSITLKQGA